ncbi:membrane fusion protein, multidrug efflux system [Tistlia consotensis]|uniref:Membrane fusion protein, multidrug efflux system n=1 Tax=Tistlia consotensis USBA 355 TaxID=560819 RepID=A0A1Y6BG23_9PROT|nr:efflux RND transporter periplasmic adaptor subunit [Tistlia consotensis]SMF02443.1 membrane fusion protein, multidrug efflux system [Tistlia consotensis USBA 355]SNR52823.1 membrane fusion protein, multidrug efflux system [Tistlia consotensis]
MSLHRSLLTLVALAVVGGLAAGLLLPDSGGRAEAAGPAGKAGRTAPVVVAKAERRDVPELARTIGTVEAAATVQIKSRVDGQVQEAFFTEGQTVRKGDLLFRLDPRFYQASLDQAEAVLQRDRAQAESARADLGRYGSLSKKGYASAQQFDQAEAASKAIAATVAADQAAVELAKLNLSYTEIRSPIDGKTGVMLVQPGNLVKANADTALVVVTQIRPVRVSFTLPQQDLPKLQQRLAGPGLEVEVRIPGDDRPPLRAKVDFIDNQVNSAAGTIALRASFDNADGRLVPGQFVNADLEITRFRNAVTVPRDAVNTGQDGPYVYVVKDDQTVEARPVVPDYETDEISVIGKGLEAGETVVRDGQLRLAPGMKVTIEPAPQADAGAAGKAPGS